jgi:ubiquinone/menaquinone biosynthesis C-methylase UbiE
MYRPIHKLPNTLLKQVISNNPINNETITKLLYEPLEEKRLKNTISSFGNISCDTSLAVRSQYEENPYPRWLGLKTKKRKPIDEEIKKKFTDFSRPEAFYNGKFQILVPGSGTGQHPIQIAVSNPEAEITAVDLSLSSLAYGKRMAKKYNIKNIEFLHGDIIDIPTLGKKFHHIDCIGVIHHMKDQHKAWETLDSLLLPGGTLHLGVYSKIARMQVTFMRNKISKLEIKKTQQEMKNFRKALLNDEQYKSILKAVAKGDFFSMSTFRDFLFHASEYQYTLSEIEKLIKTFNLNFLFFRLIEAMITKYKEQFPEDENMTSFSNWKKFEMNYAGTCSMFNFLMQKP